MYYSCNLRTPHSRQSGHPRRRGDPADKRPSVASLQVSRRPRRGGSFASQVSLSLIAASGRYRLWAVKRPLGQHHTALGSLFSPSVCVDLHDFTFRFTPRSCGFISICFVSIEWLWVTLQIWTIDLVCNNSRFYCYWPIQGSLMISIKSLMSTFSCLSMKQLYVFLPIWKYLP